MEDTICPLLISLHRSTHYILTTDPRGYYDYKSPFTEKGTKAQKSKVTGPRSLSL